ncbi:MAG: phospho-N-acetylmuramoyl-pentapeptide-transferase [Chitinophagia bacterium]|nr:phospho-N-acetylmuramoyl-pentapeptide-transferase [Chitinophagia bacterium]
MLYFLYKYLQSFSPEHLPGIGVLNYLTFRIAMAIIISLAIPMIWGNKLINWLKAKQIAEKIRVLNLPGEELKGKTPTFGGLIIIAAIILPTLLFARFNTVYVMLMLISTVWLGLIGFIDDYKKLKQSKDGLAGKFKVIGQVGLGIIIGLTLYYNDEVVIRREVVQGKELTYNSEEKVMPTRITRRDANGKVKTYAEIRTSVTNIPFVKSHEFSYASLALVFGKNNAKIFSPLIYVLFVIFIIVAVSNAANLTDGIDGLCAGTSAIIGTCLGIFAYLSGNYVFAQYLNIMDIPNLGELSIFIAAFVGATIGFLWLNSYPATIFMGDTGSLTLGGIIASLAIIVRKELLIPIMCGIFLVENLSVVIQVGYFKYTKKKTGTGQRVFLMAPLHHHFQKKGMNEAKITMRFLIVGIILAVLGIVTLKLQ